MSSRAHSSLRQCRIIAWNTYIEVLRDRILYGLIVFAVLLIGLSLALGQLSFAEQARISANFGLVAIHLSAVIIAIFIGSHLVAKEIEKKTILTILVRPLSRNQFLFGKYIGLSLLLITLIVALAMVLCLIFLGIGVSITWALPAALLGILLEALVLLSVTLLFAMFCKPMMVISFSLGVFIIGHWLPSLNFFSEKEDGGVLPLVNKAAHLFIPRLELLNWRDWVVYALPVETSRLFMGLGYTAGLVSVLFLFSGLLFRRKDLG